MTAGTESRDGDADESKLTKRRYPALRRSSTLQQHTPAAHERPLVVPPAPRAHSSHSHSSQKKRDETTSLVAANAAAAAAPANVDEELDENSEAYDTMDDAKSRDLVAEFSNDAVPKAAFSALADAQSWDHEDRDIAVSAVPPFTRTSPPSTVPARRGSHGAPAPANSAPEAPAEMAAAVAAPVVAPVVVHVAVPVAAAIGAPAEKPIEAVAVPSPQAEAVAVAAAPETASSSAGKKSAKKRAVPHVSPAARSAAGVVKARKVVAEQTAGARGRRGEGKLSARDMFRQTREIATELDVVEKHHSIDENVSAPKRANKPETAKPPSKPEPSKPQVAKQTKRSHVTFISATPDTNQQRNVPRTPKKSAMAAIDPRALISMVQDNADKSFRETKLLVTNSRLLPTSASRRAGSVLSANMPLGRMLAQAHVAPGDDSPSASAQRSGSKSVRRTLPLDAVRTK